MYAATQLAMNAISCSSSWSSTIHCVGWGEGGRKGGDYYCHFYYMQAFCQDRQALIAFVVELAAHARMHGKAVATCHLS